MTERFYTTVIMTVAGLSLAACGGDSAAQKAEKPNSNAPIEKAATESKPSTVAPATTSRDTASNSNENTQDALLKRGRIVWFKCRSCHDTSVDGRHKVGPNLHDLMGSDAGVKEGFVFSESLANSGIVWNDETLDAFIEKPARYIKGTKMAFVGIKKESDRQAVIAYIKENTKPVE